MCLVIVDNITAYLQISQFYCTLAVLEINTNPITRLRRTLTATANFFFFFFFKFIVTFQIQFRDSFNGDKESKRPLSTTTFLGIT